MKYKSFPGFTSMWQPGRFRRKCVWSAMKEMGVPSTPCIAAWYSAPHGVGGWNLLPQAPTSVAKA